MCVYIIPYAEAVDKTNIQHKHEHKISKSNEVLKTLKNKTQTTVIA